MILYRTQIFITLYYIINIDDSFINFLLIILIWLFIVIFIVLPLDIKRFPDLYKVKIPFYILANFPYVDLSFLFVFPKFFFFKKIKFNIFNNFFFKHFSIFNFFKSLSLKFFYFWKPLFRKVSYILFFFKKK